MNNVLVSWQLYALPNHVWKDRQYTNRQPEISSGDELVLPTLRLHSNPFTSAKVKSFISDQVYLKITYFKVNISHHRWLSCHYWVQWQYHKRKIGNLYKTYLKSLTASTATGISVEYKWGANTGWFYILQGRTNINGL